MISELLMDAKPMLLIIAIAAVIVFLAMMVDLVAGLYKAHLRGDAHKSEALKRTGFKFCLYEGSLLIAAGVDMLVHLSKLYHWFDFRVGEVVYGLPLITIGMGIFWCVVEFLSVREKADEKIHSQCHDQNERHKRYHPVNSALVCCFIFAHRINPPLSPAYAGIFDSCGR